MTGEDVSRGGIEEGSSLEKSWVCVVWVLRTKNSESQVQVAVVIRGFKSCVDAVQFAHEKYKSIGARIVEKKLSVLYKINAQTVHGLECDIASGLFKGVSILWESIESFFSDEKPD